MRVSDVAHHGHHGLQFQRQLLAKKREALASDVAHVAQQLQTEEHRAIRKVGREGPCVAKLLSVISNVSRVDKLL